LIDGGPFHCDVCPVLNGKLASHGSLHWKQDFIARFETFPADDEDTFSSGQFHNRQTHDSNKAELHDTVVEVFRVTALILRPWLPPCDSDP
jgi:hypothetical protein